MRPATSCPITSALNNLRGQFFTDNNLLAAGAVIVALPTLIVYFAAPEAVHQRPDTRLHEGLSLSSSSVSGSRDGAHLPQPGVRPVRAG